MSIGYLECLIVEGSRMRCGAGLHGHVRSSVLKGRGGRSELLDVSRLAKLGLRARTSLEDGMRLAYRAYLDESKQAAE